MNNEVGSVSTPKPTSTNSTISAPSAVGTAANYPATSILNLVLLKGRTHVDVATEVEALTAECMIAKGWSDTPVDGTFSSGGEDANMSFLAIKALREVDGYGIVHLANSDPVSPNREYASDTETGLLA